MPTYQRWIETGTACTTSSTTYNLAWQNWTTTNTAIATSSWIIWNDQTTSTTATTYSIPYTPRPALTEEQIADQRRRREKHNEEVAAARVRAEALLASALDDEQRVEHTERRHFHVRSRRHPGRLYRIDPGVSGNVVVIEDGVAVRRLCAHPIGVPEADTHLAQKLALETNEEAFERVANVHPLKRSDLVPA